MKLIFYINFVKVSLHPKHPAISFQKNFKFERPSNMSCACVFISSVNNIDFEQHNFEELFMTIFYLPSELFVCQKTCIIILYFIPNKSVVIDV